MTDMKKPIFGEQANLAVLLGCVLLVFPTTQAMAEIQLRHILTEGDQVHCEWGSYGSVITRVGPNHFRMELGDQPGQPDPRKRKRRSDKVEPWSSRSIRDYAFLCEGSGGIRTIEENKRSGAVIIKSLSEFYSGTRTGKTRNTPDTALAP